MTTAAERKAVDGITRLRSRSAALYERALHVMPGGNTRHTIFTAPHPQYAMRAEGCRIWDAEGVERLDFVNNYSSLIHGHCHPEIVEAVTAQLHLMSAISLPTEAEILLAELLCGRVPSMEQIRFVNSGSEAVMMAIKAARAYTGKVKVAKVEGAFHGGYDPMEISISPTPDNWGDPAAPNAVPLCLGTPPSVLQETLILPINDVAASRALIEAAADDLAAIVLDPYVSRMSFVEAEPDYLAMLRDISAASGVLLIFDEVYSFRAGYRGAQHQVGIAPDLTCLGKIIGGGFPIGAVGGTRDIMSVFDLSEGMPKVPHGGTYNANPVTMTAGHTAMQLMDEAAFARLDALGARARDGLQGVLHDSGLGGQVRGIGSMISVLPGAPAEIRNYRDFATYRQQDTLTLALQDGLMDFGVMCAANGIFILSTPMTEVEVDALVEAVRACLSRLTQNNS